MIQDTHDLKYASKTTQLNVYNGGKLVLHQTRYRDSDVKTIVTGLGGESIFYTAQQQTIQVLLGRCTLALIEHRPGGDRYEPLPTGAGGELIAPANAALRLKVAEAPCILICTPENDPNQPGGKDDLPVVR